MPIRLPALFLSLVVTPTHEFFGGNRSSDSFPSRSALFCSGAPVCVPLDLFGYFPPPCLTPFRRAGLKRRPPCPPLGALHNIFSALFEAVLPVISKELRAVLSLFYFVLLCSVCSGAPVCDFVCFFSVLFCSVTPACVPLFRSVWPVAWATLAMGFTMAHVSTRHGKVDSTTVIAAPWQKLKP